MSTAPAPADTLAKPSLRARLVRHVLLPLALTWLLGSAVTVAVAYHFAQKAFDRALLDDAYALASRVRFLPQGLALELSSREMSTVLFDQSESIYFVVRRADGSAMAGHPGLRAPMPRSPDTILFAEAIYEGQPLRTVTLVQDAPDNFTVMVGQTTRSRRTLLHDVLIYSVVPQIALLLLLALWLRGIIGLELRPLNALQRSVEQRDALDLTPVPVSASSRDIEHLGTAINALLGRVSQSLQAQREFSGNVAHELRTPLAGIRALAEYGLARAEPAVWREQLQRIGASEARASRLVEQLLALALADEADAGVQNGPVALDEVVRETVLRYLPRADAAGVDLGVHGLDRPAHVAGNVALIEGILGNLLDNALRYGRAPAGQASTLTVELACEGGGVRLSVIDNGPGLTPQERQHLMRRGVRGLHAERLGQGAGLGLAIVAKFAQLTHARFELSHAPAGPGLCASVDFQLLSRS
ncbi:MAG: sensor histidine kinase N-terminal domain-containing protein [Burkholderiales bacterium]|nr:sensor histidine kinase N-terminal domain-containing protein [Burkholderiales bacterium]